MQGRLTKQKKRIYFLGFLANTDSSILNIKLDYDFKIEEMLEDKGAVIVCMLEKLPYKHAFMELLLHVPSLHLCLNNSEKKFYYISNSVDSYVEMDEKGSLTNTPPGFSNLQRLVSDYLSPVIRLMRLFKEGSICMPQEYYYFMDNSTPKSFVSMRKTLDISPEPKYTLEDSEIPDLQKFIKNTKMPFTKSFLQLAFENFEQSYHTANRNLSFLSLMIGLESLFNRADQELSYTISRNTAVLLGKNKKDADNIYQEMKKLYSKRSSIVHSGRSNIVDNDDVQKLRHYLRESIKEINKIGKNKDELFNLLNSCGFGERQVAK